jgi:hypothetical protein
MADYKNLVPFILKSEGGLSSAQTDNARLNPSPCGNGKNGKPYHTNEGVTWSAFKSLSKFSIHFFFIIIYRCGRINCCFFIPSSF